MNKLATQSLAIELDDSTFVLRHLPRGDVLMKGNIAGLLAPVLDQNDDIPKFAGLKIIEPGIWEIGFTRNDLRDFHVRIAIADDGFDLSCRYTPLQDTQLNALHCFPSGMGLNVHRVINFRNHHHTEAVWPELLVGGAGCSTTTYSIDWQFAPHPTLLLFEKSGFHLVFGLTELSSNFGMELSADHYRCKRWVIDYGSHPHGLKLKSGEEFVSPVMRLALFETPDAFEAYDRFGQILVDQGNVPPPGQPRQGWWDAPLYCTWNDQGWAAEIEIPAELAEQSNNHLHPTRLVMNEKLVRDAVAVIKREKLPFKTILLDEGWNIARGWWEPHPQRFPNFRQLVDDLHADGFKVVIWWNWAEIEPFAESQIDPAHLISGGKRNRHGAVMRDYSLPAVQNDYLKPFFEKLFSSAIGCYDLDGVKTDFLADKVHAEMPVFDPNWRGEEKYFYQLSKTFYQLMKSIKPDSIHIGCAGNYWLARFIDVNRTYDIFGSNWREHENRARMLKCTSRGCPVAYDFHPVNEYLDEYFKSAQKTGSGVQIGSVLYCRDDLLSKGRPADADYYALLRSHLSASKETNHEI
ncbi:MAG: hypothetical protein QM811_18970 [Pirellulales bacterium]